MILDENLFEIKEARGSKEGVKRGPYNKEKSKSKEDLYDELQDRLEKEFYFPGVAKGGDLKVNLIMKDENKAELKGKKPARLIASSMSKYRDIKDEKELDTAKKIAKEMGFKTELDKTKRVPTLIIKLEESLNEKKSNRLTYHEFVDYLDSIDNGYTGFAKVTGNKGSGYRYTLSNKLTREQHDYLAQYDNVDFGTAQYRYAPEIKYDTVILLDRMSKTSPMKEDYDEDFFYTYEAIRHGESDPNKKYSGNFENSFDAIELAEDEGYDEVVRHTYDFISDNFDDYWGMPPRRTDTIWTRKNDHLNEDIVSNIDMTSKLYTLTQDNGDVNVDILGDDTYPHKLTVTATIADIQRAYKKLHPHKNISLQDFNDLSSTEYDSVIALIYKSKKDVLKEDIVKTSKGKWANKGKEGTHGEFKTKKAAREQQKAMFANRGKGESLKEEYGYYKDEPFCEEIADRLEDGFWNGYTGNDTEWDLEVNGLSRSEFAPAFADWLAESISYPVRAGHLSFMDLDMFIAKNSIPGFHDSDDAEKLIPDLVKLGIDREDIDDWLKNPNADEELEFWIDYDVNFDVDEWESNEELNESISRDSIEHDFEDITNMSDARERLKKYNIDLIKKDNRNYVLRKDGKEYTFYVLDNPNEVRKDLVKAVYKLTESSKSFDNKIILDLTIFDDNKIFENKFNTIEELDNYIREISGLDLKADNNSDTAFNKSVISRDYKGDYHYLNSKNGDKVGDVETYALLRTYIERYPDGYGVSYYDFGYISPYGWRQVDDRDIEVIESSKSHKGHWREMELKEDTETNKEVSAIRRYMTKVGMKPRKSAKEMVDFLTKFKERRAEAGTGILKENIGSDIAEYQKWVDYDMKKYGRISSLTNHKVRKAGLKIVKDKYGDYEVIANEPIREDLEREFTIHYNREGFEFGGYGAVRVKATDEDEAKEKFYAEKKDDKITISSIRPTENEDIRKGIRLLETKKVEEDVSMSSVSPEKSKINFNVTNNGDFTFTINGKEYKGHTDKPEDMSKDLKDFGFSLTEDVEVVDKNQTEIDKKVGLENLLNDLINDENEAINGYNSAIVNFELEGKSDLTDVFRDIIKDEQNHIGNLQKVLNEINPTTIANLEQGQQEAADTLNK